MSKEDDEFSDFLKDQGYLLPRKLPTGEWAALYPQIYTWALVVGLDGIGYRTRFCYESSGEAAAALGAWNGEGWPPGYWIVQKSRDGDVQNPLRSVE